MMDNQEALHSQPLSNPYFKPLTLIDLLRWRASEQPARLAYTFLGDGEGEEDHLTYQELDDQVRAIAATLQGLGAASERVLLLYPPGLEFIPAFFGCLYAGGVAVPAYPPDPSRMERMLPRLLSIVVDAQAKLVLTTTAFLSMAKLVSARFPQAQELQWLATDSPLAGAGDQWHRPNAGEESLAFLQYTSGSTGNPKGVMLTHANLLHNASLVYHAMEHTPDDKYVSWLPTFHDMGFMAGVLQPLHAGIPAILMSPMSFLQSPIRWLEAISHHKATTSGGPNFAYDLCVSKTSPQQRASLDLSNWSVAFNGAEPIRPETLERFAKTFEPCGFRRKAWYPCYGLAEATLIVSGSAKFSSPVIKAVQAAALNNNKAIETTSGSEGARELVSCGKTLLDQDVVIVHPEALTLCPPEEVGEIWVAGRSVAQGYWNRGEETAKTFAARLADPDKGPFLRTGDLGFVRDGHLFVTGRIKDLIIIRGRNYYPQDIELTVEQSSHYLRPGCVAAFSVESEGEERLVIVSEVANDHGLDLNGIIVGICRAVAQEHDLQVYSVALITARSIPKTSSGKIQRRACRSAYLADTLEAVEQWQALTETTPPIDISGATAPPGPESETDIQAWLILHLSRWLDIAPERIDIHHPIIKWGLDSMQSIELLNSIEHGTGVSLPASTLLRGVAVADLAAQIANERSGLSTSTKLALAPADEPDVPCPASHGQQSLWYTHQMTPESEINSLVFAAVLRDEVDMPALERAFQAMVDRHASLRTKFEAPEGEPLFYVCGRVNASIIKEDAAAWSESLLNERIAAESRYRFDLAQCSLLRMVILSHATDRHILLLVAHHIICDFYSLALLVQELGVLYEAERSGEPCALEPLPLTYSAYARWEAGMLRSSEGERHWDYWKEQLSGELPFLNLPTDRPRPDALTFHCASHRFNLTSNITEELRSLAGQQQATLYMVLLAAFYCLLYRYANQPDILVGSPMAGRSRSELMPIIGPLARPIVLRANLSGDPSFTEFLGGVRQTVLAALEHQDFPFHLLVKQLNPVRDPSRSPLFQVMFNFISIHAAGEDAFSAYALGLPGKRMNLGGLAMESMALDHHLDQFDITLLMGELDGELPGAFQYNADLFDAATVARMSDDFKTLLESITAQPDQRISNLVNIIPPRTLNITVAATFTSEPFKDALNFWMERLRVPFTIQVAPYNQVFQQLLNRGSLIAANPGGVNIILLRLEDWAQECQGSRQDVCQRIERNVNEFLSALKSRAREVSAYYLVGLCPESDALTGDADSRNFIRLLSDSIYEYARPLDGVCILDLSEAAAGYKVKESFDPYADRVGHIPYTEEFFAAAATAITRKILALYRAPFKVIALDCDNTLWRGVIGEDGLSGIEIGPHRRALQELIVAQHDAGLLITLCSKNNEADVIDVFDNHSDMRLKPFHLAASRLNWRPKSENIKSLANELRLGLDSFIFIDDSPIECAEVRAACPEVLTIQLPLEDERSFAFLEHLWAFDLPNVTGAGGQRTAFYQQDKKREALQVISPDLESFLEGLDLKIAINELTDNHIERVAQLIQRTNQFNSTTIRRTAGELRQLLASGMAKCMVVEAEDRFGDYGLVGVIIFMVASDHLDIETFLLSCRAIGRSIEDTMLVRMARLAQERGYSTLRLRYRPTPKNRAVIDFLNRVASALTPPVHDHGAYQFSVDQLINSPNLITTSFGSYFRDELYRPLPSAPDAEPIPQDISMFRLRGGAEVYEEIASQFQTASHVVREMRARKRVRPNLETAPIAPRTDVEKALADIWSDLLGIGQIGVHDNFFELGGHSLLATQIMSRVQKEFLIDLSLSMLLNDEPTIASLARAIERSHMSQAKDEEILKALIEIGELLEDDLKALLDDRYERQ